MLLFAKECCCKVFSQYPLGGALLVEKSSGGNFCNIQDAILALARRDMKAEHQYNKQVENVMTHMARLCFVMHCALCLRQYVVVKH